MKVLKAKLYDLKQKEQQDKLSQIGGAKKDIAFGSQIRSYVLQPYQMIKDHRTKFSEGQVDKVLNGDIDAFEQVGAHQDPAIGIDDAADARVHGPRQVAASSIARIAAISKC